MTIVGLSLTSACAGTDVASSATTGSTSGVASLRTRATVKVVATPAASRAERPLLRPDASEEEQTRLRGIYSDCLLQNGFPKAGRRPEGGYPSSLDGFGLSTKVEARITKNCAAMEPELPFERARRLDPDFADHQRAEAKCLKEHGIKTVIMDDGGPGLVDGLPGDSKGHWLDDCDRKGFANYYSTLD
jgi:hypothetical protein